MHTFSQSTVIRAVSPASACQNTDARCHALSRSHPYFSNKRSYKSPWNVCFHDLGMHGSFGRADALFVIAMQDQPLLRDLKVQFTKTATPSCGAAVTLLRWWAQMSLRANLRSMGSR